MASALLHAPFSVLIKGDQLIVSQKAGSITRTLCSLDLRHKPSFYLSGGSVTCRDLQGSEFVLQTRDTDEAQDLLTELAMATLRHGRLKNLRRLAGLALVLVLLGLGVMEVRQNQVLPCTVPAVQAGPHPVQNVPAPDLAKRTPPVPARQAAVAPAQQAPQASQAPAPDDGWSLPQETRNALPSKLHSAADRKLFTVDYSTGHARTLYVFADPRCPNCKRLEASLNRLSDAFNVVVFPVAVIGKEKSIAAITPVLCLPPEQRKAAWDALFDPVPFDPVPAGMSLSKSQEKPASEGVDSKAASPAGDCNVATKALGINQVAYEAYRIPGTPWVISDDGRYVPQALLRDPLQLQTFLDHKDGDASNERQ
jgi:TrbB protein